MFGGQDNNMGAPQGGGSGSAPQDDTLNGVSDLVAGSTPSVGTSDGGFMPTPSEPLQSTLPPADDAQTSPAQEPATTPVADDDLLDLKQQALQQLSPLVSHLDQTPEEKFRTTMMLIQASDNQALLKEAYEAAQSITDEKTKAQALLDVINEINYFTQKTQDGHEG